jgi:polar amino acid transport system substrate-binding protein
VAVDAEGVVRWYSAAASSILGLPPAEAMQQPVEKLGSRLADAVRRSLRGEPPPAPPATWTDPRSKKTLAALALRLTDREVCLGTVALLQDMTAQIALKAKEEQVERTLFWNELAASMSHEVRNPLVAIKTFAQLLPERYHEEDFRHEFSRLVSTEVDRLNNLVSQLDEFAHPPQLAFAAEDVQPLIQKSMDAVLPPPDRCGLQVEVQVAPGLLPLWCDRRAFGESLGYLLTNASEALARRADGKITITARPAAGVTVEPHIEITVADNGPGIPADVRDRVFSPFCTTKPRGLGFGLSIVKRTVVDHNGHVNIESGAKGTTITLILPAATAAHLHMGADAEPATAASSAA